MSSSKSEPDRARFDTEAEIHPDEPASLDRYHASGHGAMILGEQGSGSWHTQIDSKPVSDGDDLQRVALLADRSVYNWRSPDDMQGPVAHQHAQIRMPPRTAELLAVSLLMQARALSEQWQQAGCDMEVWGAQLSHLLDDPAVAQLVEHLNQQSRPN